MGIRRMKNTVWKFFAIRNKPLKLTISKVVISQRLQGTPYVYQRVCKVLQI